jgi:membrane protease YdiL (CAAX protease family)
VTDNTRTTTTPLEAAAICLICFGWPILNSTMSIMQDMSSAASSTPSASPFTDAQFLAGIFAEVFFSVIALTTLHMRKFAISALYPTPTLPGVGMGVLLYVVAVAFSMFFISPLVATQTEQPISHMMTQASVTLPMIVLFSMINGVYEEMFLLGFLQRGLSQYSTSTAMGVSILVRMLYHTYQGPVGVLYVTGFGLLFSTYFARTKSLFPPVFAHILWDIVAFVFR